MRFFDTTRKGQSSYQAFRFASVATQAQLLIDEKTERRLKKKKLKAQKMRFEINSGDGPAKGSRPSCLACTPLSDCHIECKGVWVRISLVSLSSWKQVESPCVSICSLLFPSIVYTDIPPLVIPPVSRSLSIPNFFQSTNSRGKKIKIGWFRGYGVSFNKRGLPIRVEQAWVDKVNK